MVIGAGIYQLAIGNTDNLQSGFDGTTTNPGHIALAFYNGLWAFDGWSSVASVTEEMKKPEKTIPRSILIAIPIITVLYVLMNLAYMTVLTQSEMIGSSAVAIDFGHKVLGPFALVIPISVALSAFGCAMCMQFSTTRLCYVAGKEGHFPDVMSHIHKTRMTPVPSVLLQTFLTIFFISMSNATQLIEFVSFLIWIMYGGAFVCVVVLRYSEPQWHRPYKVPILIAIFSVFVAAFLAVVPLVCLPSIKQFIPIGFAFVGFLVYIPLVFYKVKLNWMGKCIGPKWIRCFFLKFRFVTDNVTIWIQKVCGVTAPQENSND